jgi:hypothetical protein
MLQNKGSGRLLNNPAGVLEGQSPSVFFPQRFVFQQPN